MQFLIIGVLIIFLLKAFIIFYALKNRKSKSFNLIYIESRRELVILKNRFIKVLMFLLSISYLIISCYALIYFIKMQNINSESKNICLSFIVTLFVLIFFLQWKKYRRDRDFVIVIDKSEVIINTINYDLSSVKSITLKKSVNSQGFTYYDILLKVDDKTYWLVSGVKKEEIVELATMLSDFFDMRIENIEMINEDLL